MSKTWYFVRLAFLAVRWESRRKTRVRGTLFKQYYLVHAQNIESAFKKADYILTSSEDLDQGGRLNGKRVIFKKVGVLDIEPLYEPLQSGVEIFDESEVAVEYATIKKQIITRQKRAQLIAYEKKNGKSPIIDLLWGEKFDRL